VDFSIIWVMPIFSRDRRITASVGGKVGGIFQGIIMGQLTPAQVRTLRTPGRHLDGDGLSLHVKAPDRRYWTFRYQRDGRERVMTFGNADKVSLAQARAKAAQARDKLHQDIDPLEQKQQARERALAARAEAASVITFAQAVERYVEAKAVGWRGARSTHDWRSSLVLNAVPVFGRKAVDKVTTEDVLKALTPIWTAKPGLAGRVRNRIEMVLNYAKARGWRSGENPAAWRGHLEFTLPKQSAFHTIKHRAALDWREAPAFMARLRAGTTVAEQCLAFIVLTACRSGEARGARWSEIDFDRRVWTIPASRTKTNKEHCVPLSDPALDILRSLAATRTDSPLVFLGRYRGHRLCDVTLGDILKRLGQGEATVHGFRSAFSTWGAETRKDGMLVEAALAHVTGSEVMRAYQRSDLLDARRDLMDAWARFLLPSEAIVIPITVAA
jgi:integrase